MYCLILTVVTDTNKSRRHKPYSQYHRPRDIPSSTREKVEKRAEQRKERTEERDGFPSVEQTMVVGEGDGHDGADDDLAVDDDGSVGDVVHAEDGGLGKVDDGGTEKRAEDASVRDGEGSSRHVLHSELSVSGLRERASRFCQPLLANSLLSSWKGRSRR
jgi:hypothetical protein